MPLPSIAGSSFWQVVTCCVFCGFLSMISLEEAKALMKLRFSNRASSPPVSRKTTNDRPASHRKTTNDSSGRFELLVQHYLTAWIAFDKAGLSAIEIWCGFLCPGPRSLGPLKAERPNDQIHLTFCAVWLWLPLVSFIRTIDVLNLWWVECKVSSVDPQGVATLAPDLANWAQCTNANQSCWDILGNVTQRHVVCCSLNLDLHENSRE